MLTFNAEDHSYWLDDERIPSVTEIIRFLNVDVMSSANREMRNAAAERGTRIHEACTVYDFDPDAEVDGDIAGYVKAYADFKRDYRIEEWHLFEAMLYCRDGFAGTLDRYGEIDGVPTVLDIKTGSKLNMRVHSIQLYAYKELLRLNNYKVDQGAILHLKKNGEYSLKLVTDIRVNDDYRDIFYRCFDLHLYLKGLYEHKEEDY